MNLKAALALVHESQRAMAAGNYTSAEILLRQLFKHAQIEKDPQMLAWFCEAIFECRRRHAIEILNILKHIDPIQAERKVLS